MTYVPQEEELEDLLKKVKKTGRMYSFSAFVMEKLGYENYESMVFFGAIEFDAYTDKGGPEFIWDLLNASIEIKYYAAIQALRPGIKPDYEYES